jgi:hypothetical protein
VHPKDYEIYGDFEGSNLEYVLYYPYDVVKLVLRGDTNTKGFCKYFTFGIKIFNFAIPLRITFEILNLRQKEKNRNIFSLKMSELGK